MAANEFFVLIPQDFSNAFENGSPASADFIPDVVASQSSVSNATFSGATATITTTAAHGLRVGMGVNVRGIAGLTGFNGPQQITSVPSTTTFTFAGSFTGAYTSGGTIIPVETAKGTGLIMGVAMMERDMLAINQGVVPVTPPPPGGRTNYAFH